MVQLLVVVVALRAAPVVDGGLSSAEVADVFALHENELAPCRASKLSKPSTLSFIVDADGGVSTTAGDACALEQLSQLAFPLRERSTWVSWPWPSPARPLVFRGGPSAEAVLDRQRAQRGPIADCYLAHRQRTDNEGRFEVEVVVGPSGAVIDARPGEPTVRLLGLGVDECAARVVRGWRFAAAKGATRLSLSWTVVRRAEDAVRFEQDEAPSVAVTEADASAPPAPPLREALLRQAPRLARCASATDAGAAVTLEWDNTDAGVERLRVRGPMTPLAECVETWFAGFTLPRFTGSTGAVTWRVDPDGGVELVEVAGGLSKESIQAVVQAHREEIRFCYENLLARSPSAEGKVSVSWVIGPDGAVLRADVSEDSLGDTRAAACITNRILRWAFPRPAGGGIVNVSFPWIFVPAGKH